jgi:hypothetical protein
MLMRLIFGRIGGPLPEAIWLGLLLALLFSGRVFRRI